MKKQIIITLVVLTSAGFMVFGCAHIGDRPDKPLDFLYDIRSRENVTVTKADLLKAKNATEILPCQTTWLEHPVQELRVTTFEGEERFTKTGDDLDFTKEQLNMLHALDYNDIFTLKAPCRGPNPDNPEMTQYEMYYPFTVVPEKQAQYPGGEEVLVEHLQAVSKEFIISANINRDELKRGFVVFSISKTGEVMDAKHMISCGYPAIDDKMVELMNSLPEKWIPAEDASGEVVEQELLLFFGQKDGC